MKTWLFSGLGLAALAAGLALLPHGAAVPLPPTVTLSGDWDWRPSGDWRRDGLRVDAPLTRLDAAPVEIMTYPVGRDDYAACVAAGACLASAVAGEGDLPQTEVNWRDAHAYAGWLSRQTGYAWRLPTDAEWQRAAAERFRDRPEADTAADPSRRWLADYAATAGADRPDATLRPRGSFGVNSRGIADIAGNVWEWTDSCVENVKLGADDRVLQRSEFCGARVVEGQHRTALIDFVRDARAGGCAVGLPPDHLGFRLVKGPRRSLWSRLLG